MDEGVVGGHFALGALNGDGDGLFRSLQKRAVEGMQGNEPWVQLRAVFDLDIHTKKIHNEGTSFVKFVRGIIVP